MTVQTNTSVPKDAAHEFVGFAEQFLAEKLGKQVELKEIAEFAETASATMMGSMYAIIRDTGKEEAEAWLRRTLALCASWVRLRGADALLKFDVMIKEAPNPVGKQIAAPQQPHKEEAKEPACTCEIDAQGRCLKCSETMTAVFRGFFENFRRMSEFAGEIGGLCTSCQSTQADHAIAAIVLDLVALGSGLEAEKKKAHADQVLDSLSNMAAMLGVREIPITEKAWTEAASK